MTSDEGAVPLPDEPAKRFAAHDVCYTGTSGALYAGRDEASDRPVVVKVLRDRAFPSPADRARALRELQKLATVKHPAVARIVAVGEADGAIWIAREMVEGESLAERLARNGAMSTTETARIASQIAAALGELHRHGVLHRDVRPGHVLIEPAGAVRVIDAAIGRSYRTSDGRATTGTPGYVSPESIAGKLVSFRSDLYSLGATMYEMLTGAPPFGTDVPRVLTAQLEGDAPALRVATPPALARLVTSLLSREPRERPFSAQQVERQLEPMAFSPETEDEPASATMVGAAEEEADEFDEESTQLSDAPAMIEEARRLSPTATPAAKPAASTASVPPASAVPARDKPTVPPGGARGLGRDPFHKPTLMGISPVGIPGMPAAGASRSAPAVPVAAPARPAVDPGSGPRSSPREPVDEFDEAIDTVVQEDSRLFGVPEFGQGSPHGTAVPPLPETVAAQVLTGVPGTQPVLDGSISSAGFAAVPTRPEAQPLPARNITPRPSASPYSQPPYPMAAVPGQGPAGYPANGRSQAPAAYPGPGVQGGYRPMTSPPGAYGTAPYAPYAKPDLRPWVLAAIGVAGLAGAAGYWYTTRSRLRVESSAPPALVAPLPVPPVVQPVPVAPPVYPPSAPVPAPVAPPIARPVSPPVVHPVPSPIAPPIARPGPSPVSLPRPVVAAVHRPQPVAAPRRETVVDRARAMIAHRDYAGARVALTMASREQPNNAEIHALLGDVAWRMHELPTAIGEFRNAVRLAPRNTEYLHKLANAQVAWNDRPGAVATLRLILQANPRDTSAQTQIDQLSRPASSPTRPAGGNVVQPAVRPTVAPQPAVRPAPSLNDTSIFRR